MIQSWKQIKLQNVPSGCRIHREAGYQEDRFLGTMQQPFFKAATLFLNLKHLSCFGSVILRLGVAMAASLHP
ncbi:hypothetical protein V6Z11_D06G111600 [Gossypium hirsutum]